MSVWRVTATTVVIVALFFAVPAAAVQGGEGVVSGEVIDASGGVLPGVTVTATGADGRLLATAVTDDSGRYSFPALDAETVVLAFQLEGFASVDVKLAVQPGAESQVVEVLDLAPLAETVVVHGDASVDPRLPPPRRSPAVQAVSVHDRDSFCGPAKPGDPSESLGTIASGRDDEDGRLYTTGAELVIDGGRDRGLEVGRNLVVRRHVRVRWGGRGGGVIEHSAGLLQIVEADEHSSRGVVVYACDELRKGDFLASFTPEPIKDPDRSGAPDYAEAARILFADEGQALGAPRRLMVIGRGSERGMFVGQRLVLFRQRPGLDERDVVGVATAVAVRAQSATIRIDRVTDAIAVGDWAAPEVQSSEVGSAR